MVYAMHMTWYYSHQPLLERMNCFENVNSYLTIRTIVWLTEACALVLYMLARLSIKPGTSVMMNDTVIKMERSCRYLGHKITGGLDDNEGIIGQQIFNHCSVNVKKSFYPYCCSFYTCHLWCRYTVRQYKQIHVAYDDVFRQLMGYYKFCSANGVFVKNRIANFE